MARASPEPVPAVTSGNSAVVYGSAVSTTVSNGGTVDVASGGATRVTTVYSGGIEVVSSGGVATSAAVSSGGGPPSSPAASNSGWRSPAR